MLTTRQQELEERRALTERGCTLNGEPAYIVGVQRAYAIVRQKGSGLEAEWSWPTVRRVFDHNGGAFRS